MIINSFVVQQYVIFTRPSRQRLRKAVAKIRTIIIIDKYLAAFSVTDRFIVLADATNTVST
ncbi:hypothetical protein DCPSUM001_23640 [Dysgonomonas capnocytophagoides]|nr:hypothetical protein DCPSUM001_23640 [Dysgonomonas capnocytophagoides]